ncbi:hypothetical protein ACM9XC_01845 [Xanthomonas sacchari]
MFAALFDMLFRRTPSPDGFARLYTDALRARGYREELVYQPDAFRLVGGNGYTIYLHNAYQAYRAATRKGRAEALRAYVTSSLNAQEESGREKTFDEVRATLMPVIRNRGMFEELRLEHLLEKGLDAPFPYAWRDIAEDCVELLALDLPDTISTLFQGPRAAWGITLDEGLAIARDNLRDATADHFVEVAPGVFRGAWQDAYDTSRALLPDVLYRVPVAGNPLFMLPARDCLLVVGDRDAAAIGAMLELSVEAAAQGRNVSALVFTYDEARRMVPFALASPEHRQRQADLRRLLDAPAYADQKAALDKLHDATDQDIFVASFSVYQERDDGARQFSLCTWTKGVDTLLPRADRIALVVPRDDAEEDAVVLVSWDEAVAAFGDLMEPQPPLYPPRYRVQTFPDDAQLRQLTPL